MSLPTIPFCFPSPTSVRLAVTVSVLLGTSIARSQESRDNCTSIDCSGAGTCVIRKGLPFCDCDEGFHADRYGTTCISHVHEPPEIRDKPPVSQPLEGTDSRSPIGLDLGVFAAFVFGGTGEYELTRFKDDALPSLGAGVFLDCPRPSGSP